MRVCAAQELCGDRFAVEQVGGGPQWPAGTDRTIDKVSGILSVKEPLRDPSTGRAGEQ